LMKLQKAGSIVFIGSKNAVAAAVNASAYASAKAAALHLARCLALEGAPHGIDSGEALEAHYRDRSMLKREVLPADIANAVYFFASELSAKSTGNMIN